MYLPAWCVCVGRGSGRSGVHARGLERADARNGGRAYGVFGLKFDSGLSHAISVSRWFL